MSARGRVHSLKYVTALGQLLLPECLSCCSFQLEMINVCSYIACAHITFHPRRGSRPAAGSFALPRCHFHGITISFVKAYIVLALVTKACVPLPVQPSRKRSSEIRGYSQEVCVVALHIESVSATKHSKTLYACFHCVLKELHY